MSVFVLFLYFVHSYIETPGRNTDGGGENIRDLCQNIYVCARERVLRLLRFIDLIGSATTLRFYPFTVWVKMFFFLQINNVLRNFSSSGLAFGNAEIHEFLTSASLGGILTTSE